MKGKSVDIPVVQIISKSFLPGLIPSKFQRILQRERELKKRKLQMLKREKEQFLKYVERENQKRMEQRRRDWKNRRVQGLKAKHKGQTENLRLRQKKEMEELQNSLRTTVAIDGTEEPDSPLRPEEMVEAEYISDGECDFDNLYGEGENSFQ